MQKKALWVLLASIGVALGGWLLMPRQTVTAPDFTLPRLDREATFTLSDYRGQVVVVNFWGSWCQPCREEAPLLQAVYEAFQERGVVFVGVAVKDTESQAQAYLQEFGITYPTVLDTYDQIEATYHIFGVPVTLVIDKAGRVQRMFFSKPSEADLHQALETALR